MKKPLKLLLACATTWLALSVPGQASATLLFTNYVGESTGFATNGNLTIGTEFTVGPIALTVSRLGTYDSFGDGLTEAHQVGVWRTSDQVLVGSATVPIGTAGALVDDWRFINTTPFILDALATYRIGSLENDPPTNDQPFQGTFTLNSNLSGVTPGSVLKVSGFNFPDSSNPEVRLMANADFGTTVAVPEPTTLLLLGVGLAGLGFGRKRLH